MSLACSVKENSWRKSFFFTAYMKRMESYDCSSMISLTFRNGELLFVLIYPENSLQLAILYLAYNHGISILII
jgi:hypothetical protein